MMTEDKFLSPLLNKNSNEIVIFTETLYLI